LLEGFIVPGVVPFVLETMSPPKPHKPSISAFRFMATIMLNRRAPITLLLAVLRASMLVFLMRFGEGMRSIHEGFARWWERELLLEQTESGELQEKTGWPLGVAVPVEFLPANLGEDRGARKCRMEEHPGRSLLSLPAAVTHSLSQLRYLNRMRRLPGRPGIMPFYWLAKHLSESDGSTHILHGWPGGHVTSSISS